MAAYVGEGEKLWIMRDLDGDGKILLATDGLIATRIIAGLRDDSVLANALGAGATRQNWSQLASHLATCGLLASP